MGPKKGKKKGKKSGDGGTKKKDADGGLTFTEAVISYQLEVKQLQVSTLQDQIEQLKTENERERQRNQHLKKEQNRHVQDVIVSAQENEIAIQNMEKVPFEHVEKALADKIEAISIEQNSVEDLKEKIKCIDFELETHSGQLKQLCEYRDKGRFVDQTHISVLHKEMEDMETSYTEMSNFFDKSLATIKQTIMKQNHENIAVQKNLASEEVIKSLDPHTEQEFQDHEWLLKEVNIHRNNITSAEGEIKTLEKQNIEVMSYLFQQQVEDLKQCNRFNLACKAEDEKESSEGENSDEEVIEEHGRLSHQEELPDDLKWLEMYLHEFDTITNHNDYQLDPVEVKLLCVIGNKAKLNDINDINSGEGAQKTKDMAQYNWIVEREDLRQDGGSSKMC